MNIKTQNANGKIKFLESYDNHLSDLKPPQEEINEPKLYILTKVLLQQYKMLGLSVGSEVHRDHPHGEEFIVTRIGVAGRLSLRPKTGGRIQVESPRSLNCNAIFFKGEKLGLRPKGQGIRWAESEDTTIESNGAGKHPADL